MPSKLATVWTQGVKEQKQREDFETTVRNSTVALGRLYEILEEQEKSIMSQSSLSSDYSQTDWAFKQAHRNGQLETLRKIKELLEFIKG